MIWFFWYGKLSFLRYCSIYSACKYNKEVTLVTSDKTKLNHEEWNEKTDYQVYKGKDYTPLLNEIVNLSIVDIKEIGFPLDIGSYTPIHLSDLFSFWILAEKGGTYSDMDIIYWKKVPELTRLASLIKFTDLPKKGYVPVSFMQGSKNNIYKTAFNLAVERYNPDQYDSCGEPCLQNTYRRFKINWLDEQIVFPFAGTDILFKEYKRYLFTEHWDIPGSSIGVHWYAGTCWKDNLMWTMENWRKYDCTMRKILQGVFDEK